MFPKKINGKYAMLSRPSDNGHTPFGDIFMSYSPDMKYWGEHRNVMQVASFQDSAWQQLSKTVYIYIGMTILISLLATAVTCRVSCSSQ